MPNIVNVSVTQQVAPAPSTLQSTGALVSQGATTLASGTYALLTQLSDLSSILTGAVNISSITWATNVATVTTSSAHGIPSGDTVQVIITGVLPAGYNGTFLATSTGTTTFTTNGVLYGNGVGPLQVTVAGTDGQVLVSQGGVPQFRMLDGGTF